MSEAMMSRVGRIVKAGGNRFFYPYRSAARRK